MKKARLRLIIPLVAIGAVLVNCIVVMRRDELQLTWRHLAAIVLFCVLIVIYSIKPKIALISTGIYLVLATFGVLGLTPMIEISWLHIFGVDTPHMSNTAFWLLVLFGILNTDKIIEMVLDYKEKKGTLRKETVAAPVGQTSTNPPETKPTADPAQKGDTYKGLRRLALNSRLADHNLQDRSIDLYGVVFDMPAGENRIITVVGFITGDASVYLSSGAAMLGAGKFESVRLLSRRFVDVCRDFMDKAKKSCSDEPPDSDHFKVYYLTAKGRLGFEEPIEGINNRTSLSLRIFDAASSLSSEISRLSQRVPVRTAAAPK